MRTSIKYGSGRIELDLPPERFAGAWGMESADTSILSGTPSGDEALSRAVEELDAAGLRRAAGSRRVGLLLPDGTREWSPERLLPPLWGLLGQAERIIAFLCTGTHDTESPENLELIARIERVLAGAGVPGELVVNDCRRSPHRSFGRTARGTRIEIHERSDDCELFLTISDMKNHYFAGYSNPVKYLLPGIASREAIRGNHSLTLEEDSRFGRHPWHPDPSRRTNPLSEDLLEAFETIVGERAHFALTLITSGDEIYWAGGGATEEATRRGIGIVDQIASLELPRLRYLVVSPGGHPHDESLYTAQRALELSSAALQPGSEVLFLARCPNGIGPPGARENFFDPLTRPLEEITEMPRSEYTMYAHKPVKFARYLEGLTAVHMGTDLSPEEVTSIHMSPVPDPQAVIDAWVHAAGADDRIGFLDDASKLAIHAAP
jgi:lactate racemase